VDVALRFQCFWRLLEVPLYLSASKGNRAVNRRGSNEALSKTEQLRPSKTEQLRPGSSTRGVVDGWISTTNHKQCKESKSATIYSAALPESSNVMTLQYLNYMKNLSKTRSGILVYYSVLLSNSTLGFRS
jgi:hypothetical protein